MPSLSNKAEPAVATDAVEFSKSMVVMMEKKIRNLEKRKGKLEDYKTKQNKGQTLNDEQLKAVAKLDDVLSQIELLQDLTKQVNSSGAEIVKQQKRQQKKERFEQSENERKRFAEILSLQGVLNALGEEETRQAFADGTGGAVKLEEQELNHLDELYKIINPERCADIILADQVKSSAEHLQMVLDGRDKAISGTTYRQLNDLISKIKDCSFFTVIAQSPKPEEEPETNDTSTEKEFVVVHSEELPHADSEEVQSALPPEVPVEQPAIAAVEQQGYQQQQAQVPPTDPSKTFEEIVENVQGRFNFIQDSEIDVDSPSHVDPAVVSVHQMPAQHYQQQQPLVSHSQPENSTYQQQTQDPATYQQYNMQSSAPNTASTFVQGDAPQPIPMPNESSTAQPANQSMFGGAAESAEDEHIGKFGNSMTFESSALKQQEKPSHSEGGDFQQRGHGRGEKPGDYQGDFQQRGHGPGGKRGGYRGRGYSNGYGGRGAYRGGDRQSGGFRGGDRQSGGDRSYQSGNGYQSDRRAGRSGPQRGGNAGNFRGGNNTYSNNGRRGGFRGQQQQANVQ